MGKTVNVICLAVAMVVAMLGISIPSHADPPNTILILLKDDGTSSNSCVIDIKNKGNLFKGVCKKNTDLKKCNVKEFTWRLENETGSEKCALGDDEFTVVIKNAPGHLECFPDAHHEPWFVAKFTKYNEERTSGPPSEECTQDKFGTYWPYVISLYGPNGLMNTTDPGGVIFP